MQDTASGKGLLKGHLVCVVILGAWLPLSIVGSLLETTGTQREFMQSSALGSQAWDYMHRQRHVCASEPG